LHLRLTDLEPHAIEPDLKLPGFGDFYECLIRHAKDELLTNPTPAGNGSHDCPPIRTQKNRLAINDENYIQITVQQSRLHNCLQFEVDL
jgi:hypothetical protein